jgi:hypothetical protein
MAQVDSLLGQLETKFDDMSEQLLCVHKQLNARSIVC